MKDGGRAWGVKQWEPRLGWEQEKEEALGRLNRCSSIKTRANPGRERAGHGTSTVQNSSSQRVPLYHTHLGADVSAHLSDSGKTLGPSHKQPDTALR